MATIKAIEARSVHQIQSGQVIVDLCSVVKELVENSLDAGATNIEVRFRNNGLDLIEVQDNGSGISSANYESVALKHYTSKLSNYDDLSSLETFGFRGEALSSLCALSTFHIVTAQASEVPKGKRLDFDVSGRLTATTVVASQRGTIASVEGLFEQLPVRRKELTKNIKREYGKVIGLLHAYACISTNVKILVRNAMPKGKNVIVFATKSNTSTKENIANVYGAKTLGGLVPLDLKLVFQPSTTLRTTSDRASGKVLIHGHISRPGFGEGRQTPDRQMFFVNSRPCGLPQIAKAFNEVYRSFNVAQSPFIFADLQMDTNVYDVNVSPDKRTILLHDSAAMIESLKASLVELFEQQEQTMPQSQLQAPRLSPPKPLDVQRHTSMDSGGNARSDKVSDLVEYSPSHKDTVTVDHGDVTAKIGPKRLPHHFFQNQASTRDESPGEEPSITSMSNKRLAKSLAETIPAGSGVNEFDDVREVRQLESDEVQTKVDPEAAQDRHVRDFNKRLVGQQKSHNPQEQALQVDLRSYEDVIAGSHKRLPFKQRDLIQNAFDRMRPRRTATEVATITIGDKTMTTMIGSQISTKVQIDSRDGASTRAKRFKQAPRPPSPTQRFTQSLRSFAATGTQAGQIDKGSQDNERTSSQSLDFDNSGQEDGTLDGDGNDDRDVHQSLQARRTRSRSIGSEEEEEEKEDDDDYMDEAEKKVQEEARVAALIRAAEESATVPSMSNVKRANRVLRSRATKDFTTNLVARLDGSLQSITEQTIFWQSMLNSCEHEDARGEARVDLTEETQEERLSLAVSKEDFGNMRVVGQFNLGFVLAVRPSASRSESSHGRSDELFIIDQHASDEKVNFERLQAETVVGNQQLVLPLHLHLTAVEEEIIMENGPALEKNGFIVEVDTSGDEPIGERCKLTSLPLSKEVVFGTKDLEELIHLLSESPTLSAASIVPRPTKVRKMFAMRACRSSIMIGKTLSQKQMSDVVRNMGMIDKPWNCPHGRPTMRHLTSLNVFTSWHEGEGLGDLDRLRLGEEKEDEEGTWMRYGQ